MTTPDRKPEYRTSHYELPKPKFLLIPEIIEVYGESTGKWIGLQKHSPEDEHKTYVWWRNLPDIELDDDLDRYKLAAFAARIKIELNAEIVFGNPIDISKSDNVTEEVVLDTNTKVGVYVLASDRPIFNFRVHFEGVRTEDELRNENKIRFMRAFQQAQEMLPRP